MTRLLLGGEVAEILRVPAKRVRTLRARGELEGINVGTDRKPEYRYRAAAVDTYLDRHTVRPGRVLDIGSSFRPVAR